MQPRLLAVVITVAVGVVAAAVSAGCSGATSTTSEAVPDSKGSAPADPPVTVTTTTAQPTTRDQTIIVESSSTTIDDLSAAVTETYDSGNAIDMSPIGERLPSDSSMMAAALIEAERAIREPDLDPDELSRWGRWQQRLYHHLASASYEPEEVLALVGAGSPDLAEAIELNWEARWNLIKLLTTETTHSSVPAWRIVAINLVETRMGRIQGVSTAGAVGPMQFLPSTWAECCQGDPTEPRDAIIGAATYLTVRGGPENMDKAIWGYNNLGLLRQRHHRLRPCHDGR